MTEPGPDANAEMRLIWTTCVGCQDAPCAGMATRIIAAIAAKVTLTLLMAEFYSGALNAPRRYEKGRMPLDRWRRRARAERGADGAVVHGADLRRTSF
jgi:hypothetical protein